MLRYKQALSRIIVGLHSEGWFSKKTSLSRLFLFLFEISSTDESFVWRGEHDNGSIKEDEESESSGSALVDSCL